MPPAKGSVQQRGIDRRDEILRAAVELFAERGYRGTGLLAIAERAGISHSGVLHHFGTKENLLRAAVAQRDESEAAAIARIEGEGLAALASIGDVWSWVLASRQEVRLFKVLLTENLDPDAPLHDYFVERHRRVRERIEHEIRVGQARGEIREDIDPTVKATEVLAFAVGLETQWLLDPDSIDPAAAYRSYSESLVLDLRAPESDASA